MAWRFIYTDSGFVPQGEIDNIRDVNLEWGLSKLSTCTFNIRLDHPLANSIATNIGYVKAYDDGNLRFYGPIISTDEAVDGSRNTLSVSAVDPGWYMANRLAGKSTTGTVFSTLTDRATIAKSLIDAANTENEMGISTTVETMTSGSTTTFTAGPYRNLLETVAELGNSAGGFDWQILPVENFAGNAVTGTKIAAIRALANIGSSKPNAVFEFGEQTRNNVSSFRRATAREGQANKVYHIHPNGPQAGVTASDNTTASDASKTTYRLLEDLVSADITDAGLRLRLVNEHVSLRQNPRQLVYFQPHVDPGYTTGRVPRPHVDYTLGDIIPARIRYAGVTRFDGTVRVWGMKLTIDSIGMERYELTLEQST